MAKEAVLIHGWDPEKYNSNFDNAPLDNIAWNHRAELIRLLSEKFKLHYYNLPGFCGVPEPEARYYDVENFTNEFAEWMKENGKGIGIIIGYSFGGAIALDYKTRFKTKIPTVLVAPAILRQESMRSRIAHSLKVVLPGSVTNYLKSTYQQTTSEYYRQGTPFLRLTYDTVVRRNLSSLLEQVDKNSILLVYGDQDDATPWSKVEQQVTQNRLQYHIVDNGTHDIGQTHPEEIVETIASFLAKQK